MLLMLCFDIFDLKFWKLRCVCCCLVLFFVLYVLICRK